MFMGIVPLFLTVNCMAIGSTERCPGNHLLDMQNLGKPGDLGDLMIHQFRALFQATHPNNESIQHAVFENHLIPSLSSEKCAYYPI